MPQSGPAPPPYSIGNKNQVHSRECFDQIQQNPSSYEMNQYLRIPPSSGNFAYPDNSQIRKENQNFEQRGEPSGSCYSTLWTEENADAALLSKTLAFINTIPAAPAQPLSLSRPILIPQLPPAHGLGTPFMRAWAPCLSVSNVNIDHFLGFIDSLNVISLPSPPLQVLKLAGSLVGMVPNHWAQLAGAGLQYGAQIGATVVSKQRTDKFLKEVNERVFLPRRLRVKIVKGEEVPRVLRMTETQAILDNNWDDDLLQKVLKNIQPYSAPLIRKELPVSMGQDGILDKWSAKAVEREQARIAKRALKGKEKEMGKEEKRLRKDEKRARKELRKQGKRNKKHRKHSDEDDVQDSSSDSEDDGHMATVGRKGKVQEKEMKMAKKLLWILIESRGSSDPLIETRTLLLPWKALSHLKRNQILS
ncbi:hypothetical protein LSUE1_G007602 [Lachnellula suecica]|uniref:Uncharacterized protein n=1 Tax=Lachnellula suecica TaxID=602035 RepID=A0A8T9BZX1_9HELO|nr:hypothetical protein LSUE1_G007602 [Lachnellula suecica]